MRYAMQGAYALRITTRNTGRNAFIYLFIYLLKSFTESDMTFIPESSQLRGLSFDTASLFGMPHIGCKYTAENIAATAWSGERRRCACCGRTNGYHSRHHEPPRSKGSFLLSTPKGKFVLLPALIDLCGTGTTGCHGDRHARKLIIRWRWDTDEYAEMWWSGELLSMPFHPPHGDWLYQYGYYEFQRGDSTWRYRG